MRESESPAPARNLQLDFFRGAALMIIFVNHIPFNDWFFYTPSRFGFSDAAEIFVFLSGFAAALAYGRCFQRAGLWLGTIRVLHRCWQIYAAHLTLFFLLAVICVLGNAWTDGPDYIHRLYIHYFFDETREALSALVTLHYVPNYFDILPMYLIVMLWIPFVWMLSRVHVGLALGFSLLVYLTMWQYGLELAADPRSDRPWYFNPFGWQLLFFTGFALGAGWLRPPACSRRLVGLCLVLVIAAIPLAHEPSYRQVALFGTLRALLEPWLDKSHFGPLRWLHFLALAYLIHQLFKAKTHWLTAPLPRWIAAMGRQSLPIFMLSMALSYVAGMILDGTGRDPLSLAAVNLGGWALLLGSAQGLAWLQTQPWKSAVASADGSIRHAAAGFPALPGQWLRNLSLAAVLLPASATPLLLIRKAPEAFDAESAVTVNQWPGADDAVPEDVFPQAEFPDRI